MNAIPKIFRSTSAFITILLILGKTVEANGQTNWPHWRGPKDDGVAEGKTYPTQLDSNHVIWKSPLPGKGCSSPIVWNQRIYVTAPIKGVDAVMAFDWSGKQLWQKTFGPENAGKHRNGSGSNPSPVTDGNSIFVYYKSGTFAALDFDGNVRWQTNLVAAFGPDTFYWDHGTSPVLIENAVVMTRMHHGESWVAVFEKKTGAIRWKAARNFETPVEGDHSYSTPLAIQYRGKQALLVYGAEHLTVHDTADGKLIWSSTADFNPDRKPNWPTVASPVISGDTIIVASARSDRGFPRLHGIKLGAVAGGLERSGSVLWKRLDTGNFVPTPAVYKDKLYMLRDRGEVECLDPTTGKSIWTAALPKASPNYYASPVIAGGNLYAIREDGKSFVARIEDGAFKLLSENDLGERVIASPAAIHNRIIIRGEQNLLCFE